MSNACSRAAVAWGSSVPLAATSAAAGSSNLALSRSSCASLRSFPAYFAAWERASSSLAPAAFRARYCLIALADPVTPLMTPSSAAPTIPPSRAFLRRPSSSPSSMSVDRYWVTVLLSSGLSDLVIRSDRRPALPSNEMKSAMAPLAIIPLKPEAPRNCAVAPTAPGTFDAAAKIPSPTRNPGMSSESPSTNPPTIDLDSPSGFVVQSGIMSPLT